MNVKRTALWMVVLFLAVAAGSATGVVALHTWTQRCTLNADRQWTQLLSQGGSAPAQTAAGVRQTLRAFQQGYVARDTSRMDAFIDQVFVPDENLLIVGIERGEARRGQAQARQFLTVDWKWWGDFRFDSEQALVWSEGDVAWMLTVGKIQLQGGGEHPVVLTGVLVRQPAGWRFRQVEFQIQKCPQPYTGLHPQRSMRAYAGVSSE